MQPIEFDIKAWKEPGAAGRTGARIVRHYAAHPL
jgi:hypothetical protein